MKIKVYVDGKLEVDLKRAYYIGNTKDVMCPDGRFYPRLSISSVYDDVDIDVNIVDGTKIVIEPTEV